MSDIFKKLAEKIIKEQEAIIGPVAWEQASKVPGLKVNPSKNEVDIEGQNPKEIIEQLVKQYQNLFGLTSVEVCKHAVKDIVANTPHDQLPPLLL